MELNNGVILEIQHFIAIGDICHLVGKEWDTSLFDNGVRLNHIRLVNKIHENNMTVPISDVKQKLVCMIIKKVHYLGNDGEKSEDGSETKDIYVCIPPNTVEVQ